MSMPEWVTNLGALWDWVDKRRVVLRIQSIGTFILNVHVVLWVLDFAASSQRTGTEIALIVGAVNVPLTALQGYMYVKGGTE